MILLPGFKGRWFKGLGGFIATLGLMALMLPSPALAQFGNIEVDARDMPWASITRMALESGTFPPAYRPVSENELMELLASAREKALAGEAPALDAEFSRLEWLLNRYQYGEIGYVYRGCSCKDNPPNLRLSGRVLGGYSELGNPVDAEGGLNFAAGYNTFFEPSLEFAAGKFWSVMEYRFGGRLVDGGDDFSFSGGSTHPLTWPGWPAASGKYSVREARLKDSSWNGRFTRALVGVSLGNWALSAGWDQRDTGPGLTGSLNLGFGGHAFPAITARRTDSFHWSGIMTHLAPDQTLFRAGLLSRRTVDFSDEYGAHFKEVQPRFFQWLVGWNVTSWFRTQFTHTVMATPREGTLCPDLLQINFPVIGTTWREGDSGPITDRIFAAQFEFRWRKAPWPLLPSSAGRLFWDYGGTDFLPSGPGGVVPQISLPASIVGVEFVGPHWDLCFEYAEIEHDKVLWYSNGGYQDGYTQDQWVMGHQLGGSGESFTGLVRLRPAGWGVQAELKGRMATWGLVGYTPGNGSQNTLALTLHRTPSRGAAASAGKNHSTLLWEVMAEWTREKADPSIYYETPVQGSEVAQDWWRLVFKVGI